MIISVGPVLFGVYLRYHFNYYQFTGSIFGFVMFLIGAFLGAISMILEEKFFRMQPDLDPILVSGFEGVAGVIFWVIAFPIMNSIRCNGYLCSDGYLESIKSVFADYRANPIHIFFSVLMIIYACITNMAGLGISKYGSAASRETVGFMRSLIVWFILIVVPINSVYL